MWDDEKGINYNKRGRKWPVHLQHFYSTDLGLLPAHDKRWRRGQIFGGQDPQ